MSGQDWQSFREELTRQAEKEGVPISGIFELTARCNLSCNMCYICRPTTDRKAIQQELTADQWYTLAKQARDAGMLYVLLTGGEVFLRHDFKEIYQKIYHLGLIPTIYTNGTLLTPALIGWLQKIQPEKVEITIYGASAEMYGKVCGTPDAYQRVVTNIDRLLDAGFELRLKTTVIEANQGDYEALEAFALQRKIPLKKSFYITPSRVDDNRPVEAKRLAPSDLAAYLYRATQDYCEVYGSKENEHADTAPSPPDNDLHRKEKSAFHCSAGRSDVWFTWQGHMTGCGIMRELRSTPLKDGFSQAWEQLRAKMAAVPTCVECSNCEIKRVCITCPARLKNETGRFDKPSEYLCEFAKNQRQFYGENYLADKESEVK